MWHTTVKHLPQSLKGFIREVNFSNDNEIYHTPLKPISKVTEGILRTEEIFAGGSEVNRRVIISLTKAKFLVLFVKNRGHVPG